MDEVEKNLSILPLGRKQTNLIYDGRLASLFVWSDDTESGINSNILKSMNIWLYSGDKCHFYSPGIDFKQRHYCGTGGPSQLLNPVISLKTFCLFNFLN